MEYVWAGCSPRIGGWSAEGPITKQYISISHLGSWVPEDDFYELEPQTRKIYCQRAGHEIDVRVCFRLTPSADQIKSKPGG